jgi:hypothetical protein
MKVFCAVLVRAYQGLVADAIGPFKGSSPYMGDLGHFGCPIVAEADAERAVGANRLRLGVGDAACAVHVWQFLTYRRDGEARDAQGGS